MTRSGDQAVPQRRGQRSTRVVRRAKKQRATHTSAPTGGRGNATGGERGGPNRPDRRLGAEGGKQAGVQHRPVQGRTLTLGDKVAHGGTNSLEAATQPIAAEGGGALGVNPDQTPEPFGKPPPQALRADTERAGQIVDRPNLGTLDGFVERHATPREEAMPFLVATGGAHRAQLAVALGEAPAEGACRDTERPLDLGDGAALALDHHPVQSTAQPGVTLVTNLARRGGEDARWKLRGSWQSTLPGTRVEKSRSWYLEPVATVTGMAPRRMNAPEGRSG